MNQYIKAFVCILLLGCTGSPDKPQYHSTLKIGDGEDVIVSIDVTNNKGINKLELRSNGKTTILTAQDLSRYPYIQYGFENKGEGTFHICIYSGKDTTCSEHYVEGGYRPKLECSANQIQVIDHTGY